MPTERKIVAARTPFATSVNGRLFQVSPGDLFWSDDPVVANREGWFEEPKIRSSQPKRTQPTSPTVASVETATASPGEQRYITKPLPENVAVQKVAQSKGKTP